VDEAFHVEEEYVEQIHKRPRSMKSAT